MTRLSPYDFRRTFVGDLLNAGEDVATMLKTAGHAVPAATSRTGRLCKQGQKKAASLLRLPCKQRLPKTDQAA